MDEIELLVDFYSRCPQQGPGGKKETLLAADMAGLNSENKNLKVLDIGCGTGTSSLILAEAFGANVTAVDLFPEFLKILEGAARAKQLNGKVKTREASMGDLPFSSEEFDIIWSEGAIYNMGFSKGIEEWQRFLKKGGVLAVSEITWLTASRPSAVQEYWEQAYPEVAPASKKFAQLEASGYMLLGYFPLPQSCWTENYYQPLEEQFPTFLEAQGQSEDARKLVESEKAEINLYRKYCDYYSYGFYVAQKL